MTLFYNYLNNYHIIDCANGRHEDHIHPGPIPIPLVYQIWYTSSNGQIVNPHSVTAFGANIIDNTYEDGQGVITFDGEITEIGDNAFASANLKTITIPDSVKKIGKGAFYYSKLESIVIPDSVTSIDNSAFKQCDKLQTVYLGAGIENIAKSAFDNCYKINSINTPNSVKTIGDRAFYSCQEIIECPIGESVQVIGAEAFRRCQRLTSVIVPDSVTEIGGYAFAECSDLQSIQIGKSVEVLWNDIVDESRTNLTAISVDPENTTYDSRNNCNAIILTNENKLLVGCDSTVIPNGIVKIDEYAFYGCNFESLIIPESVTRIEQNAFDAVAVKQLTCKATTPPYLYDLMFEQTEVIYVPANAVDVYKAAPQWSHYADKILPIEE